MSKNNQQYTRAEREVVARLIKLLREDNGRCSSTIVVVKNKHRVYISKAANAGRVDIDEQNM
jgi:hypothetical protein